MKISYTKYGDYYLPDLTVPNKEYNIGRFGMMRLRYIKAHRSCFYTSLKLSGKLMDYIQETDNSAQQMYHKQIQKKHRFDLHRPNGMGSAYEFCKALCGGTCACRICLPGRS